MIFKTYHKFTLDEGFRQDPLYYALNRVKQTLGLYHNIFDERDMIRNF
jgi:hypothetical protein